MLQDVELAGMGKGGREPGGSGRGGARIADLVAEHHALAEALAAVPLVVSTDDLLRRVEETQDAVDRLGLGGGGSWAALEAMTDLGVGLLKLVAAIPASSPDEARRRATAYARQRCGTGVAGLLSYALERDRRRLGMSLHDLAAA